MDIRIPIVYLKVIIKLPFKAAPMGWLPGHMVVNRPSLVDENTRLLKIYRCTREEFDHGWTHFTRIPS